MRGKSLDSRICAELKSLNAGLLRVLAWCDPTDGPPRLGLEPAVVARLQQLRPTELDFIAGTPALLAGFDAPPAVEYGGGIADAEVPGPQYGQDFDGRMSTDSADAGRTDQWARMTRLFAAALLTWLWQMDRGNQLVMALCIGPRRQMPPLSVPVIEALAGHATQRLRVRFGDHPRFWPDLIRAARSKNPDLRDLSRLAVLPLVLAEEPRQ
jgi:hypothetical protein